MLIIDKLYEEHIKDSYNQDFAYPLWFKYLIASKQIETYYSNSDITAVLHQGEYEHKEYQEITGDINKYLSENDGYDDKGCFIYLRDNISTNIIGFLSLEFHKKYIYVKSLGTINSSNKFIENNLNDATQLKYSGAILMYLVAILCVESKKKYYKLTDGSLKNNKSYYKTQFGLKTYKDGDLISPKLESIDDIEPSSTYFLNKDSCFKSLSNKANINYIENRSHYHSKVNLYRKKYTYNRKDLDKPINYNISSYNFDAELIIKEFIRARSATDIIKEYKKNKKLRKDYCEKSLNKKHFFIYSVYNYSQGEGRTCHYCGQKEI